MKSQAFVLPVLLLSAVISQRESGSLSRPGNQVEESRLGVLASRCAGTGMGVPEQFHYPPPATRYPLHLSPQHLWHDSIFDTPVSLNQPDTLLLQEALFHATNEVRKEKRKPLLEWWDPAGVAAQSHSVWMARHEKLSHTEPDRKRRQPGDRLFLAAGERRITGENVHFLSLNPPPAGLKPPVTYRSWARKVLEDWMNSRGHRANILEEGYLYLGTGASFTPSGNNLSLIYATQVFCYP